MRFLITGATGFLGWRSAVVLEERGHEVIALARPHGASRATSEALPVRRLDAGDARVQDLVAGCDAVLHFAGVPDPARARADPAHAVRENAGTTLNLLEGCAAHAAGLVYPSTVRAAPQPPPDAYAMSKRLGEECCRRHTAEAAVVRLPSVFGPGQVAREGATGAIAAFAARALEGAPIVIPGNPRRTRDFVYVDDLVVALETLVAQRRFGGTFGLASGASTPLIAAAELVRSVTGSDSEIETPGGALAPGEDKSYETGELPAGLGFAARPLRQGVEEYVDWLRRHPTAQGRTRA